MMTVARIRNALAAVVLAVIASLLVASIAAAQTPSPWTVVITDQVAERWSTLGSAPWLECMLGDVDPVARVVFIRQQQPARISEADAAGMTTIVCPAGSFGFIRNARPDRPCQWTTGDRVSFLAGTDRVRLLWCDARTVQVLSRDADPSPPVGRIGARA